MKLPRPNPSKDAPTSQSSRNLFIDCQTEPRSVVVNLLHFGRSMIRVHHSSQKTAMGLTRRGNKTRSTEGSAMCAPMSGVADLCPHIIGNLKSTSTVTAFIRGGGLLRRSARTLLDPAPSEKIRSVTSPKGLFQSFFLTIGLIAVCGCGGRAEHKNVCPIDGQPPEWSKPIDAKSCEYFHFSTIERQTHSWTAPCEKNTLL